MGLTNGTGLCTLLHSYKELVKDALLDIQLSSDLVYAIAVHRSHLLCYQHSSLGPN